MCTLFSTPHAYPEGCEGLHYRRYSPGPSSRCSPKYLRQMVELYALIFGDFDDIAYLCEFSPDEVKNG